MDQDKRENLRLEQEMPIRQRAEHGDSVEDTTLKDISSGGLRIATDTSLDIGAKLNIELNITGTPNPFYAIGEVVWHKEEETPENKKFDMGIRFVRIVSKTELEGF